MPAVLGLALATFAGWAVALLFAVYLAYRIRGVLRERRLGPVARIKAKEVAGKLASPAGTIAVYDVRSHGYYDKGASRIKGSVRIEPNALPDQLDRLPKDKEVVLYCTCLRDATSVRVARILRDRGVPSSIIRGGLRSWQKAGLPMEQVPEEDVVLLPTFAR